MGKIILITECDSSCPYFKRHLGKKCKNPKTFVNGKPRRILEAEFDESQEFPEWCDLTESMDYNIISGEDAKALREYLNRPPDPEKEKIRRERAKEFEKGFTKCLTCGAIDWEKGWQGKLNLKEE